MCLFKKELHPKCLTLDRVGMQYLSSSLLLSIVMEMTTVCQIAKHAASSRIMSTYIAMESPLGVQQQENGWIR